MAKSNVVELSGRDTIDDPLRELLRTGAEQLIYQAVDAELRELLVAGGCTHVGVWSMVEQAWYATAICRRESCRRVWGR